mgnify:FL=1
MTPGKTLNFLLIFLFSCGLLGCGRRGPTESPLETQAYEKAMKAKEAEEQKSLESQGKKTKPKNIDASSQPGGIPGTTGNRPPEQFPFPLDPIL